MSRLVGHIHVSDLAVSHAPSTEELAGLGLWPEKVDFHCFFADQLLTFGAGWLEGSPTCQVRDK